MYSTFVLSDPSHDNLNFVFFQFWVLLRFWALEVGSLLLDFCSFKFQGSFFHSSKLNVNMEFIDFDSYHVCALISFDH
jgi:hypothetical protein